MLQHTKNNIVKRILLFLMVIVVICLFISPPVYLIAPGVTKSTSDLIEYEHHSVTTSDEASFYFTTILMKPTSWAGVFKSFINPHEALMMKSQVTQGLSLEAYQARAQLLMLSSYYEALEAAYKHLDVSYIKRDGGLYVNESLSSSSFFVGDKIVAVVTDRGEYEIHGEEQLLQLVNIEAEASETIQIIVENNKQKRTVLMKKETSLEPPLNEQQLAKWLKVKKLLTLIKVKAEAEEKTFQFKAEQVGGASAGLILTLTMIDVLSPNIIETDQKIAATGTITIDGKVGIVGGIEQKVVAVAKTDITLFLVPQIQAEVAQKKAESLNSALTIVGVSTLSEAIEVVNRFK